MKRFRTTFMAIALLSMAGTSMVSVASEDAFFGIGDRDSESYNFEDSVRINYQLAMDSVETKIVDMRVGDSKGAEDLYFWSSEEGDILRH